MKIALQKFSRSELRHYNVPFCKLVLCPFFCLPIRVGAGWAFLLIFVFG